MSITSTSQIHFCTPTRTRTEPLVKDMEKYASGLKEALASSRQFVAKVHDALNTTAGRPSPLQGLKDLLLELQQQPILLRVSERSKALMLISA